MHILIVEDELGICEFLREGLEEEGYEVSVAKDGRSALLLYGEKKPDLILLDWMLPGMEGVEVCKVIRQEDQHTPILFLTAKDTVQETIEGLRAGANDYVKKPFSFEELLERIRVHFRDTDEKEILVLGDIRLYMATRQVFNAQDEVVLTQKEFELLEFLIRNKNTVCSREKIIDKVWNIRFEYDTGVIDVFINSIRKKLGMNKEIGYIKTIRGIGYIAKE